MEAWKLDFQLALTDNYPGVLVKWNGDNPILEIPNELVGKMTEIANFASGIWESWGGDELIFSFEDIVRHG